MKLVPARPQTIVASRTDQRWFPALYRHTDGSLLLYVQCGHDAAFVPFGRWRSYDRGHTWIEEEPGVPRCQIVHSFSDGTLLELDLEGFHDATTDATYYYYGQWSVPDCLHATGSETPGLAGDEAEAVSPYIEVEDTNEGRRRDTYSIEAPSAAAVPLAEYGFVNPYYPWWPLIERANGKLPEAIDQQMGAPAITDIVEVGGRLLAAGYARRRDEEIAAQQVHRHSVFCYESRDRGRSWKELSILAANSGDTPEGFNETALTVLKDGRLYGVVRGGDRLFHTWSADEGVTWSLPEPLTLIDSDTAPRMVWPRLAKQEDGTLVLAYGRPGKHLVFDPSGTGTQWQGHLDLHAWELGTQELMGVPETRRLRGDTANLIRHWDSGDYLSVVAIGPRELLVTYDVQCYVERAGAAPVSGVRMVRVQLETNQ